jgi:hypothetical protein
MWRVFMSLPELAGPWLAVFWVPTVVLYLVFLVYFWGSVARALGKDFWLYGLLVLFLSWIPIVNLIPIMVLAFDESAVAARKKPGSAGTVGSALSLCGVAGEMARVRVAVPPHGIYIGRNPARANVVLHSTEISNIHVRVWPDASGAGLWLQDANSLNGTYYCRAAENGHGHSHWKVLRGQVLLYSGAHFRLGDKVAEFAVC